MREAPIPRTVAALTEDLVVTVAIAVFFRSLTTGADHASTIASGALIDLAGVYFFLG